ncbi:unnamed protein product [Linum trigynum]|uniref:CCHC-type domain-containing protein n=1 Tax=Linum trigynum TaxID=586398 RepID=A0AAV2EPI2_9ROSI
MEIKDLDHDCFLVRLDNEQDYFRALTDGPWVIFDHYLIVQQWTPNFKASDPLPKTMIVWVQLPALKIHFYHKEVVTTIGNLIGRTIKLDYHTLTQQRAKFARLAVEVDLSKHLVPRIWLDDAWQKVEYENLPEVCFECGRIGHCSVACPLLRPAVLVNSTVAAGGESPVGLMPGEDDPNPGFGPWMLVSRKSRRVSREGQGKGNHDRDGAAQIAVLGPKQGKRGTGGKDANKDLPSQSLNNGPLPHRNHAQERKDQSGKKISDGSKKGNEKKESGVGGKGKGLLGPGPEVAEPKLSRPKPSLEVDEASTSAQQSRITPQAVTKTARVSCENKIQSPQEPKGHPPLLLTTKTVTGQNGTVLQVVEIPQSSKENADPNLSSAPSLTARTKNRKAKSSQQKKSPTKLNTAKPLQIWSPVKDRKPKSKARAAMLTLQEINAWTEAARISTGEVGGKAFTAQATCDPLTETQTAETPPSS